MVKFFAPARYVRDFVISVALSVTMLPSMSLAASETTGTRQPITELPATRLDNYGLSQLSSPVVAPIQLYTGVGDHQIRLVRFSSLPPNVLAFFSDGQSMPTMQRFRIVDKVGRVMPMALRQVQKSREVTYKVPVVAVEADNPAAMEKLRQAIRIQIEEFAQPDHDKAGQAVHIELKALPTNQPLAQANPQISTWWLANPMPSKMKDKTTGLAIPLHLDFSQLQNPRPVQLQLYGSDDLQRWQILDQAVVNPFKTAATPSSAKPTNHTNHQASVMRQTFFLNPSQANYRYWQLIASQPLVLNNADVIQTEIKPSYFLTRALFNQVPNQATSWQLNLPAPLWVSGIEFFVPEQQLWQVTVTNDPSKLPGINGLTSSQQAHVTNLGSGQVTTLNARLYWTPSLVQNLSITGQMQADSLPVTLLTPVYELYFLAQGQAPYQLLINEPTALTQPVIALSNEQLARLGESSEAQLLPLMALDNPDAEYKKYRQWGLWAVLLLILVALSWLAYRLYQQITTQRPVK